MKIEQIFVICHRRDVRFVRTLVASIRHWYRDIPIALLKDQLSGAFSTREIERAWNVTVVETGRRGFGWGWGKLEPLFLPGRQRCLLLDADILLVGRVLDALECQSEDLVVCREEVPEPRGDWMRRTYYDYDRLLQMDPDFRFPGFTFNAGQLVATTGVLKREDFSQLVDWSGIIPRSIRPDIFPTNDQSVLNYLLVKKARNKELTLGACEFGLWPKSPAAANLDLDRIIKGEGYPLLIHWAGLQNPDFRKMPLAPLLLHFEQQYYSRVRFSFVKRFVRYIYFRCAVRWHRFVHGFRNSDKNVLSNAEARKHGIN